MDTRQTLVAGNWKLNGTRSGVVALAQAVVKGAAGMGTEVLLCPSYVHLADVLAVVENTPVRLGAQDCSVQASGAFTGESSAHMLTEFGCKYVIIGHSERRQLFAESDTTVAAKFFAVQAAGLTPILCVGETLEQRQSGDVQSVIDKQIDAVLSSCPERMNRCEIWRNTVIAYEPVWAIGTGESATPEQAQEVHAMIRNRIATIDSEDNSGTAEIAARLRILYGGSVKRDNAADLFGQSDIDGGLIGGASLKAEDFLAICTAA